MTPEQSIHNVQSLWARCLEFIRDNVESTSYNTWFVPIEPHAYKAEEHSFYIKVPTPFFCEFLEEHYVGILQAALEKATGAKTQLFYMPIVDSKTGAAPTFPSDAAPAARSEKAPAHPANRTPEPQPNEAPAQELDPHLNPRYRFDNFIEGISNRLPRSIGESIAQDLAKTFNPLFLWGTSGVGKTHLLNAIGARIKELHPEKRVLYISAHLFMVQYTDSVRHNRQNDFFHFYQTIDALIIDDIQEFAGVKATQNTFFHIFNHLYLNGKQIILAADRPPMDLQGFEERLLTRFKAGALVELEKPTVDLRRAILKNKIQHDGLSIPPEVVEYLAQNVNESVREFEGILCSIMAHSTFMNRPIDLTLAENIVRRSVRIVQKKITLDDIVRQVCEFFSIAPDAFHSRSRKRNIVTARQVAMYLAKKYTEESSSRIGQVIGQRDHSTVVYACKTVQNQYEVDKSFQTSLDELEQSLRTVS